MPSSHRTATRAVRPAESFGVDAVRSNLRPARTIAEPQMRSSPATELAVIRSGKRRQGGAGSHGQAQSGATAGQIHVGATDAPNEVGLPTTPRHEQRDERRQIAVIHPTLDDVGPGPAMSPASRRAPR